MATDPLDDVFNLEDQFYQRGYELGRRDGVLAGKVEGRSFGMQKGFEKFIEGGRLAGKSVVWGNRTRADGGCSLPALASNPRLDKNITSVYALMEPGTLSTQNTDAGVQEFDDRFKRATGKAKVVERVIGPGKEGANDSPRR